MGELFNSLSEAVDALAEDVRTGVTTGLAPALEHVREWRDRCVQAASRRARLALDGGEGEDLELIKGEWLNYAALLVQVERIVADLAAPLPT